MSDHGIRIVDEMEKPDTAEFDHGVIVGMGLACSEAASYGSSANTIMQVLNAAGLDRAKLIEAGLEEFDMEKLGPALQLLEVPEG